MLQAVIIVLAVAADQLTKYVMSGWLLGLPERTYPLIQNVVHFTYVENRGMAFGLFQNTQIPLIIITSLILVAGLFFMIKEKKRKSLLYKTAVSLVVGGAVGNLIDRAFIGYVVDFIDLRFINFFVFNVSDSCITIGAVLAAVYILFYYEKDKIKIKKESNG